MEIINKGHLVGYVRVSSIDQNVDRQLEQLKAFKLDATFIDRASGKSTDRPELQAALKHLRRGDTFIIYSMDRLARNLDDLRNMVNELSSKGITVQFIKENMSFTGEDSPMSKLLLSVMGAFAEFERSIIRERQKEGIAIAKDKGVYSGRKLSLKPGQIAEIQAKDKTNNHKDRAALAREFGISRETLYKYLKTPVSNSL